MMMKLRFYLLLTLFSVLANLSYGQTTKGSAGNSLSTAHPAVATDDIQSLLNNSEQKMHFVANKGQWDANDLFRVQGYASTIQVRKGGFMLSVMDQTQYAAAMKLDDEIEYAQAHNLPRPTNTVTVKQHAWMVDFVGMNPAAKVESKDADETYYNYFIGNDPSKWATNVGSYQEVWYKNVYNNIDARLYAGNNGEMEYDLIAKPGADIANVKLRYTGLNGMKVSAKGDLIVSTALGDISYPAPVAYQQINGQRVAVSCAYVLDGISTISFNMGKYDKSFPVVIDPVALRWAAYINTASGSGNNHHHGIEVDNNGYIYSTGKTDASNYPTTTGVINRTYSGNSTRGYLAKLNQPSGINGAGSFAFLTYFGGTSTDNPYSIKLDASNNIYITGVTSSSDFPRTSGSYSGYQGGSDAFVIKINNSGTSIIYSTMIGGSNNDEGDFLYVDAAGQVYVAGSAQSGFPTTSGAYQTSYGGSTDAFWCKLNASGSSLLYSTYYGGSSGDVFTCLRPTADGNYIILSGSTSSSGLASSGAFQTSNVGSNDNGLVVKFRISGTPSRTWATYINPSYSSKSVTLLSNQVDDNGNVYIGGITSGISSAAISSGAYQTSYGGGSHDLYLGKLNSSGSSMTAGTYIGGSDDEVNFMGINIDTYGDVYGLGYTKSTNLNTTSGAMQTSNYGNQDAVFLKMSADYTTMKYLTYWGGSADETDPIGFDGIKFSNCRAYTALTVQSQNAPMTKNSFHNIKTSSTSVNEQVVAVWSNPPDVTGDTIMGNETLCAGVPTIPITGSSTTAYSVSDISRNGSISAQNSPGTITYSWQKSTDGTHWTTIAGATGQNLTTAQMGTITQTTYYERIISGDFCQGAVTNIVTKTVPVLTATYTKNDASCSMGSNVCHVYEYSATEHAFWLPGIPGGPNFVFGSNGGLFKTYPDGTAHLSGVVYSSTDASKQWVVDLWFAPRLDWNAWEALMREWKGDSTIVGNNYETWDYYTFDTTQNNILIGNGSFAGDTLHLTQNPPDAMMAMQVGLAANDKNGNMGISDWFNYTGTFSGSGDINLNMVCDTTTPVCNGTLTLSANGGTAPYTFSWNNGITSHSNVITGLCPGVYTATITDSRGCRGVQSFTINDQNPIIITCNSSDVTSQGGSNGTASVNVSGGVPPYTYLWSNGATTQSATNVPAGVYYVTVTDAGGTGCSQTGFCNVNQPSVCTGFKTITQGGWGGSGCAHGNNPTSYLYNNFSRAFPQGVTVGCSGGHTLKLTSVQAVLDFLPSGTTPRALTSNYVNPAQNYRNVLAGQVVTLALNVGFDAYDANFGPSTQPLSTLLVASGPMAGMTVAQVLTIANNVLGGCSTAYSASTINDVLSNINENYDDGTVNGGYLTCNLTLTVNITNPVCNGANTGTVDLTVTGGVGPYTYHWNNGAISQDLTNVAAGTYNVTVTDHNGLTGYATATVTQPTAINISLTATSPACYGSTNGSITSSVSGGTAPYTYRWSNNATTANISNLVVGTYTVTVTDANHCTAVASKTLTQPTTLTSTISKTDVSCGSGNGPCQIFEYQAGQHALWLPDLPTGPDYVFGSTGGTFQVFTNGTAHMTGTVHYINDATKTWTIDLWFANKRNWTQWSALGRTWKGTASIVGTNYVNWDYYEFDTTRQNTLTGGGSYAGQTLYLTQKPADYSMGLQVGLAANDKNAANGMSDWFFYTGSSSGSGDINLIMNCGGGTCDGAATVTAAGGTTPYTYSWSNGATTSGLTSVCAGTYTVTVTDAHGCTTTNTVTIGSAPNIAASASKTDATCYGSCNGTATASATGGTAPLSYHWSTGATTANITNLCAGSYTVTVTDAHGCSNTASVTIGQPDSIAAYLNVSNVSCTGQHSGSIDLTVTGGTAPYSYLWSNSATSQDLSNLTAGVYNVKITDAHGCIVRDTAAVIQMDSLNVTIDTVVNVGCHGDSTGHIDITVTGGNPICAPVVVAPSTTCSSCTNSISGNTSVNIVAGQKVCILAGNTYTGNINMTGGQLVICGTANPSNFGVTGGTVTIIGSLTINSLNTQSGLTIENYGNFNINTSGSVQGVLKNYGTITVGQDLSINAPAGTFNNSGIINIGNNYNNYNYTVNNGRFSISGTLHNNGGATFDNNCTLTAAQNFTNDNIFNNNGSITVGMTSYLNGTSTLHMASGTFFVTKDLILNATIAGPSSTPSACVKATGSTIINSSGVMNGKLQFCELNGIQTNNGTIASTVTISCAGKGTLPTGFTYTYHWSTGDTTQDLSHLPAGTYTVTVTDGNGCSAVVTVTVTEPTRLTASAVSTNPSCSGGATGNATSTVTGGTTPYTYHWSNNATTANLSNIAAGTYGLTVTDAHGCSATASVTLTDAPLLTLTLTPTNPGCNGASTGSITSTVGGGTTPYTYHWSNNATTANLSGLAAGTYAVTVTDSHGCSATGSATLTNPPVLVASATSTPVSCFGGNNGAASSTVTGGTAPYTYHWSNNASTANITGLVVGGYSVTVTDAHGCTAIASTTVNQPGPLTLGATPSPVSCNGGSNGSIDLTVTGGTAPYTYTWNTTPVKTTEDISGLTAGTYSVTVVDAHSCSATVSVTVNQPQPLNLSLTGTNPGCNGAATGSITSTIVGGTSPYTYHWSNNATTANLTNVTAGTYGLTITDANGCTATGSKTLTDPLLLTLSLTPTNPGCNGASTGSITSTVAGGTGTYTYHWSNNATTANLSSLAAGTYGLTVTDANGCSATASTTLTNPPVLTASATGSNPGCNGAATGSATSTVTGGTTPYTYHWSNNATTANLSNIVAGTYGLTVTDAHGCSATTSVTLTDAPLLTASATGSNPACHGDATGSATSTVTGGTTPYTYHWSNNATTANLSGIAAGTYGLTVTDAHGCSATASVTLTEPATLTASATGSNPGCNGASTGSATSTVTGGTTPYTYHWSNNATTANLSGIAAGTYGLTVTDAHGCSATTSVTLTNPPVLTASATGSNPACHGDATGSATSTVAGGTTPYTYHWSNNATTANLSNIVAGTYGLTVTDAHGCTATASVTLTEPATLTASATGSNPGCNGAATGSATSTVAGGTTPYTYHWSNNATTANLSNIVAGTYGLTVTDAHGCTATTSVTLTDAPLLTLNLTPTNPGCNGDATGSVTSTVAGGTTPYTYHWSNNATTANLSSLLAGTYGLTVTDNHGCSATGSVTLTNPPVLTTSTSSTPVHCFGGFDGSASVVASGGTSPYTYHWNNNATTATITGKPAGTYTVTVTDAHGCTKVDTARITQPGPLTLGATPTPVNCNGGHDGSINLTVTGGTPPFVYHWSTGDTTQSISGLSAGTYNVSVTDANNCSATVATTVNQPNPLSLSLNGNNPGCSGGATGNVTTTVSGGTTPYTYHWSNGATTANLSNVAAGTYTVTVTDLHGCTATGSKTLTDAPLLTLTLTPTNPGCNGASTGSITSTVAGGSGAYTYHWSNNDTTANISGLAAGTYGLTVVDAHGCSATGSATLTNPPVLTASATSVDPGCNGASTGSATSTVAGGTTPYTYHWSNNATTANLSGIAAGTYGLTVTDAHGCTATASVTLTNPPVLTASATSVDPGCYGASTGTATSTVGGGTAPYTYHWSNNATTANLSGIAAGTYGLTVTDAHGCTATASVTLTNPPVLTDTISKTDLSCGTGSGGCHIYQYAPGSQAFYLPSITSDPDYIFGPTGGAFQVLPNGAAHMTGSIYSITDTTKRWNIDLWFANKRNWTQWSALGRGWKGDADSVGTNYLNWDYYEFDTTRANRLIGTQGFAGDTLFLTQNPPTYYYGLQVGIAANDKNTLFGMSDWFKYTGYSSGDGDLNLIMQCAGGCDGTALVAANGGTTPYHYSWNNGDTTQHPTGLCAGTYTVTITDAHGCTKVDSITINNGSNIVLQHTSTNVSCAANCDGTASVTATGGVAPYTYSWSNGSRTANASNLCGGSYFVTVTDAHGCMAIDSVFINANPRLQVTATPTDVLCFGGSTGAVTTTVAGGVSPYTYHWSNNATTANITNVPTGTYTVIVSDTHGCADTTSATVGQPSAPITTVVTTTPVHCFGGFDGSATVTAAGGTAPYTYHWSSGSVSTATMTGKPAGTYTVTVTDAHGCTKVDTARITQPGPLTLGATPSPVSCNGGNNGSINLSVTGGTPAFRYHWSTGDTTQNISGLTAGTYSVTVIDANSCSATVSTTVNQPNPLNLSGVVTNVNCYSQTNGGVVLSVVGGTSPYTYTWSNGQSTKDLTSVAAGTYTVHVVDRNGCSANDTFTITQPNLLTVNVSVTNANCNGQSNGSIASTTTGGTAPYHYAWSSGDTTQNITGKAAGAYTVTVTDAHGCSATATDTIRQPQVLTASATSTPALCVGDTSGTATLTVAGGTTPYTYHWSNGATTQNLAHAAAGSYTVTVTDAHGCSATASVIVNSAVPMTDTISVTNARCFGENNGSLTVSATGGQTPYTYHWSNGATTATAANLVAGTYFVTVTDANGCAKIDSGVVTQPLHIAINGTPTNLTCNGDHSGAITLTVTGGTGTYTYHWSNGATTQNLSGLAAGTYKVTVNDAPGCADSATYIITQPTTLATTLTSTNVHCFGESNGSATVTATGGTPAYTYHWSNGATTAAISNLAAGTYIVTTTDAHGCSKVDTAIITQPNLLVVSDTVTNVSCNQAADGTITLTVTGGTTPYRFHWLLGDTTQNLSGLGAGTYNVTVTDANNCTASKTINVTQPQPLNITGVITNVNCYNEHNGGVALSVTGGTPTYTYTWSNGQTTQNLTNVGIGTYSVHVADSHGCTANDTFTIVQPDLLTVGITVTNASCSGMVNGGITSGVNGGTPGYHYLWSTGDTTRNITGKPAGTYSLTVTDSHGCTATATGTISQPSTLSLNISATDVSCNGGNDGTATVTVTGGTAPFTYLWSNGGATATITNLVADTFSVTVTDAHGCASNIGVVVHQPTHLALSAVVTNINCSGDATGAIDLTVTGGVPAYTYHWSNGATTQDLNQLNAGTYRVTVTDSHGCNDTASYTVIENPHLSLHVNVTDVACNGGNTGSATVVVTGGTAPYHYLWNNPTNDTTATATGFTAGSYVVTVRDSLGCADMANFTVNQPTAIQLMAVPTPVTCNGGNDGAIHVTVAGGVPAYTFAWSNGDTTQNLANLVAGTYVLTVTDAHSCTDTVSVVVAQPTPYVISITGSRVSCYGDSNGHVTLTVSGNTSPYSYSWNSGDTTQNLANKGAGTYIVTITDAHGCASIDTAIITTPDRLVITDTVTDANCNGGTGSIHVGITGGTPAYMGSWSGGGNTLNLNNAAAGTYTLHVHDMQGCMDSITATIGQPSAIVSSTTVQNVQCFGGHDGAVSLTVSGGVGPYTYHWSTNATTQNITGLAIGLYRVTITDAHGCTKVDSGRVQQPGPLTLGATTVPVTCNGGSNGSINLTVTGGNPTYMFHWSTGDTTQNISGLAAGTYNVTVVDAHNCSATVAINVSQPQPIRISGVVTNATCSGTNNGGVVVSVVGGTSPYTYAWSSGQTTKDLTNVGAGTYIINVTDNYSCTAADTFTITQPAAIVVNYETDSLRCNGNHDGEIALYPSGGSGFTYHWSNGQTSSVDTNLTAGTYTVTVTNSAGCSVVDTFTILQPTAINAQAVATGSTCSGGGNGTVTLTVSGGSPGYIYHWNTGATTQNLTGQGAGTYTVTVTDAHDCSTTASATITQPSSLSVVPTVTNVRCFGGNNGSVTIAVTGGVAPYTYHWSNNATTQNITGLRVGSYTVTVTDASGCNTVVTANVAQPGPLTLGANTIPVNCYGASNGSINLIVSGGVNPYTFGWNTGATTQNVTNLAAGTYNVTVVDSNSCNATVAITVLQPAPINLSANIVNSCNGGANGSITLSVVGGTAPYTYNWSNGATTKDIVNLVRGSYSVSVVDHNGCSATKTFAVDTMSNCNQVMFRMKVMMEGPFDASTNKMTTTLNSLGVLPLQQPFSAAPMYYPGTEAVTSFSPDVTDWIFVSFRTGLSPSTEVYKTAALLHNDGYVYTVGGDSIINFNYVGANSLYVVVEHRNHMGIMSASAIGVTNTRNNAQMVDFTRIQTFQVGNPATSGQKIIGTDANGSIYGMYSGDGDCNFDINSNDFVPLMNDFNRFNVYSPGDYNMDGDCNSNDIPKWVQNFNFFSGVQH